MLTTSMRAFAIAADLAVAAFGPSAAAPLGAYGITAAASTERQGGPGESIPQRVADVRLRACCRCPSRRPLLIRQARRWKAMLWSPQVRSTSCSGRTEAVSSESG